MKQHEIVTRVPIARGEEAWRYGLDGGRCSDAIGSWRVKLFGHANPLINAAIRDQVDPLTGPKPVPTPMVTLRA